MGTLKRWAENVALLAFACIVLLAVVLVITWGLAEHDAGTRRAPCQTALEGLDSDHISVLSTADTATMTAKGYVLSVPEGGSQACGSVSYGGTAQEFSMEFGDCTASLVTTDKDVPTYDLRKGYSIPNPDPYSSRILVQTQRASDLPNAQDLKKLPAFASCR